MTFIDIHSHLEFFEEKNQIKKIIENAREKNVGVILACGINSKTNRIALDLSEKFPEIKACLGIYPSKAIKLSEKEFQEELDFIKENKDKIIAVGEIGLDLKELDVLDLQEKRFRKLLEFAKEIKRPVVIHSRKAEEEAIEILEEMNMKKVLMHCFCGKKKLVKRILENKWYLSIPTSVKSSRQFQEMVELTPIEQLFCETDSPFLHPDKKFPNEPANVVESYKKISKIKKLSLEEVEKKIEDNFKKFR